MKTNTLLSTAVLALASFGASAAPIFLNNGFNYITPVDDAQQVNATSTGVFNEFTLAYYSTTVLTDANGDGVFSAGDTGATTGGLFNVPQFGIGDANLSSNRLTDIQPGFVDGDPTTPSANGMNQPGGWQIGLAFNNLTSVVNATGGLNYTGGDIYLRYYDSVNTFALGGLDVLKLTITSGGNNAIGLSLDLEGTVTLLNGASAIAGGLKAEDLFNFAFGGGVSFADYLAGDPTVKIYWDNNQNTSPYYVNGVKSTGNPAVDLPVLANIYGGVEGGTGVLSGRHDGSVEFDVPEPASLLLLGAGLLGLAGTSRRRNA